MNKQRDNRLKSLAVIGIILFIVIQFIAPSMSESQQAELQEEMIPAVTQAEAVQKAEKFVNERESAASLQSLAMFQTDKMLSGYLQKNDLTAPYLKRFQERYPTEFYRIEVKHPRMNLFYYIDIHMQTGEVVSWNKQTKQTTTNPQTDQTIAQKYIQQFVPDANKFAWIDPQPHHSPGTYVFQHQTDKIGSAPLQIAVAVRDGEVVSVQPQFAVPADHREWQNKQDTIAERMSTYSLISSLVLTLIAIIFAVIYRREAYFGRGVVFSVVFLAIYMINNISMYPATKIALPAFTGDLEIAIILFVTCLLTLALAAELYFSFVVGERWSREFGLELWPSWKDHNFGSYVLTSMRNGYLLCLLILGIQALLYLIAENGFDSWSVSDPTMSMYNMLWPALFPLMAWVAGISEEAVYRLFGILLFKRLLRNTFLAVLIPSVIWALSHSTYPVYPAYTRLIEVTILGIIFGYAFLKYGLYTAIFAHVAMDSILMALSYMYSFGTAASIMIGLGYIASPALVAYLIYFFHTKRRKRITPLPPAELA